MGLFLFDVLAGTAGCHDSQDACAPVCGACSCGTRLPPQDPASAPVDLRLTACVPREDPVYVLLLPRSIFHPPRLAV
ncbi:MAG: hypothetical protein A2X36_01805 [Elusimicrobia bacterium GWA2_69_24]|nr:MAG: hypothetical protein A2X36_01805 [Elusimicrobia bacterium GWA2_69_24]HBL16878.1 hypothetical protein [Elusimicrobiota bacterium]